MLGLENKTAIINMLKELKETILQELKEYTIKMYCQVENITEEIQIIKTSENLY